MTFLNLVIRVCLLVSDIVLISSLGTISSKLLSSTDDKELFSDLLAASSSPSTFLRASGRVVEKCEEVIGLPVARLTAISILIGEKLSLASIGARIPLASGEGQ